MMTAAIMLQEKLQEKYAEVGRVVNRFTRVGIAVSGGIDSTLLLSIASRALGADRVLPLFADSVLQTVADRRHIVAIGKEIGCPITIIEVDPLADDDFVRNPVNRCYHCKKKTFTLLLEKMRRHSISTLMDGTNYDDLQEVRPGLRVLEELQIVSPLAEAGMTKEEVRLLGRQLGLSNWNRPSGSCLATRIEPGRTITDALLAKIERCETYLHSLGFAGCRVRLDGDGCRLELAAGDLDRFANAALIRETRNRFIEYGMSAVFLDMRERRS
jgi:uncharacterized protein